MPASIWILIFGCKNLFLTRSFFGNRNASILSLSFRTSNCVYSIRLPYQRPQAFLLSVFNFMKNIVVLISGRGSNFKAVYETSAKKKNGLRFGVFALSASFPTALMPPVLEFAQKRRHSDRKVVDHKKYEDRESFERSGQAN